jgi:putative flippase GtrA
MVRVVDLSRMSRGTRPAKAGTSLGRQALRYGLVGVGNTVVGYTLILTLHAAGFSVLSANVVGFGTGLVVSYLANRVWTFGQSGLGARNLPAFAALVGAAFLLNYLALLALLHLGFAIPAAQALGIALYSVTMFLGLRHVVFAASRRGARLHPDPTQGPAQAPGCSARSTGAPASGQEPRSHLSGRQEEYRTKECNA